MNNRPGEGVRYSYGYGGLLGSNNIPAFSGASRMGTDVEYQIK